MNDFLNDVKRLQNNGEGNGDTTTEVVKESKTKRVIRFYFMYIHWIAKFFLYSFFLYALGNEILNDLIKNHKISFSSAMYTYILFDIFIKPLFEKTTSTKSELN